MFIGNDCAHGAIRIEVGNGSWTDDKAEGIVEICRDGVWGGVCNDDLWDMTDAKVACRQLGYSPNSK